MSLDERLSVPTRIFKPFSLNSFNGAISLESISFPEEVEIIGPKSFYGCEQIEGIEITKNIKVIGENAFGKMKSLKEIGVDKENEYFIVDENGVLYDKEKKTIQKKTTVQSNCRFLHHYTFKLFFFMSSV